MITFEQALENDDWETVIKIIEQDAEDLK